jgi:hypothetical protein
MPPKHSRFKPGQSGNPAGRPPAGLSIREWYNTMAEWTVSDITAVLEDGDAPASKIIAAKQVLDACSNVVLESGMPIRGQATDRICDRTHGKPKQAVELTGADGGPVQTESHTFDHAKFAAIRRDVIAGSGVRGTGVSAPESDRN